MIEVPSRALIGGSISFQTFLDGLEFWFVSTPTLHTTPPYQGKLGFLWTNVPPVPHRDGLQVVTFVQDYRRLSIAWAKRDPMAIARSAF